MPKKLAICAPQIGAISETFIQRHMQKLMPGNTVVLANSDSKPYGGHWRVDCPFLIKNKILVKGLNLGWKDYVARKLGRRSHDESIQIVIKRFLQDHQVKVIMGEFLPPSLYYFPIAQKLDIPFFAHAHGADVSAYLRQRKWQEKYLQYQQAAGIITMNQVSRQRLIDLGLDANKIHIIPYGIEVPQDFYRRREKETVHCLAVGRLVAKKAPIFLLESFRRALEAFPNLRLDYIGTGDLLPAARQFIQAFGLTSKVILHGGQPYETVSQFMKKADIFLQHSIVDPDTGDEEGLPLSILEAMGYGLPLVSTRHTGIPEAVSEAKTGFLVDEGDCQEMAQKLVQLAKNRDLRLEMGLAAWQRAKEFFNWEREKNSLLDIMNLPK